jgi:DDE superfamily endonuclease
LSGLTCIGFPPERTLRHSEDTKLSHFVSAFGINPNITSIVFQEIQVQDMDVQICINKPKVPHFLLALHWLKRYPIEQLNAGIFGYHEDTVRKWVWKYCTAIQALKPHKVRKNWNLLKLYHAIYTNMLSLYKLLSQIVWINHNLEQNQNNQPNIAWFMSVDGVHCMVQEPRNVPDKDWYSHKHNKPCVAYEIGLDLQLNQIVWTSGPHKAGETDLVIFRKEGGLRDRIPEGFKIIGDKGYMGDEVRIFKRIARARHEDLNGRLKRFDILSERFRHKIVKHKIAFEAVCVLVQYTLENGQPLHSIPIENL